MKGPDELPRLEFGADGQPTKESMANLLAALKASGVEPDSDPANARVNYFKTSEGDTANLDIWIQQQQRASKAGSLRYKFCSNNCATFVRQGLIAGGAISNSQANQWNNIGPNALFFILQPFDSSHERVTVTFDGAVDCTKPHTPGCN